MGKSYKITFTRSYIFKEDDLKAVHNSSHARIAVSEAWKQFKHDIAAGQPFADKDNFKATTEIIKASNTSIPVSK